MECHSSFEQQVGAMQCTGSIWHKMGRHVWDGMGKMAWMGWHAWDGVDGEIEQVSAIGKVEFLE